MEDGKFTKPTCSHAPSTENMVVPGPSQGHRMEEASSPTVPQ